MRGTFLPDKPTVFRDGHIVLNSQQQMAHVEQMRHHEFTDYLQSNPLTKKKFRKARNPLLAQETTRSARVEPLQRSPPPNRLLIGGTFAREEELTTARRQTLKYTRSGGMPDGDAAAATTNYDDDEEQQQVEEEEYYTSRPGTTGRTTARPESGSRPEYYSDRGASSFRETYVPAEARGGGLPPRPNRSASAAAAAAGAAATGGPRLAMVHSSRDQVTSTQAQRRPSSASPAAAKSSSTAREYADLGVSSSGGGTRRPQSAAAASSSGLRSQSPRRDASPSRVINSRPMSANPTWHDNKASRRHPLPLLQNLETEHKSGSATKVPRPSSSASPSGSSSSRNHNASQLLLLAGGHNVTVPLKIGVLAPHKSATDKIASQRKLAVEDPKGAGALRAKRALNFMDKQAAQRDKVRREMQQQQQQNSQERDERGGDSGRQESWRQQWSARPASAPATPKWGTGTGNPAEKGIPPGGNWKSVGTYNYNEHGPSMLSAPWATHFQVNQRIPDTVRTGRTKKIQEVEGRMQAIADQLREVEAELEERRRERAAIERSKKGTNAHKKTMGGTNQNMANKTEKAFVTVSSSARAFLDRM